MEKDNYVRVIALSDIWNAFAWHIIPIVLVAIMSIIAVFVYGVFFRKPLYQSTATLYILRQESGNDYAYTSSDFSLALNVVSDCDYMLKSHAVLDDVIDEVGLDISYNNLAKMISTRNPEGSRILEVTVEADSPDTSKKVVDAVCRIGSAKISNAMGVDQVNVYDYGTYSNRPSNNIGLKRYALVGIASAVLVYTIYLVQLILDDKVKTEEDVHKYLDLSVLGDIPNASKQVGVSRYGRYGSGKKYGKYGKYYSYAAPKQVEKQAGGTVDEGNCDQASGSR